MTPLSAWFVDSASFASNDSTACLNVSVAARPHCFSDRLMVRLRHDDEHRSLGLRQG